MRRQTVYWLCLLGCIVPRLCSARTLNVPDAFPTIQAAIDTATPGDIVQIASGTYEEQIVLGDAVHIVGAGIGVTTIAWTAGTVIHVEGVGPGTSLEGLTVDGQWSATLGIDCRPRAHLSVKQCEITRGRGGVLCDGATVTLDRVVITDMTGAAVAINSADMTIRNSRIARCAGDGIHAINTTFGVFGTVISDAGRGIACGGWSTPIIRSCQILRCTLGIDSWDAARPKLRGSEVLDSAEYGIRVGGVSLPDLGTRVDVGLNHIAGSSIVDVYDGRPDQSRAVAAVGNWWGTLPPREDQFAGNVNYTPWLPAPDARPPSVSLSILPDAVLREPYYFDMSPTVEGLTGDPAYAAEGLPDGLELSAVTGVLSGAPTEDGTFILLLSVTDDIGLPGATEALLVVFAERPVVTPTLLVIASPEEALLGDVVTVEVRVDEVADLAGYEFTLTYDPSVLGFLDIEEGTILNRAGVDTFWIPGDLTEGAVTGIGAALLGAGGINDGGIMFTARLTATGLGESSLLVEGTLGASDGSTIPYDVNGGYVVVSTYPRWDVTQDGVVDIADIVIVAHGFGETDPANPAADINSDGIVNILDVILVARHFGESSGRVLAAPRLPGPVHVSMLRELVAQADAVPFQSFDIDAGLSVLRALLASATPDRTSLLPNYPNPFNPETWIPFDLADAGEVTIYIYDAAGMQVRRFDLGNRSPGTYHTQGDAVRWDGRNEHGEPVGSGVYLYEIRAGTHREIRRMVVQK